MFGLAILEDVPATTMACTLVLTFKVIYALMKEAKLKGALGGRAPEDAAFNPERKPQKFGNLEGNEKLMEKQQRWGRICANDLENIPLGLIIAWGAVFCGASPNIHIPAMMTFTLARCAHTILYANGSLLRPVAFGVGLASVITMGVCGIIARVNH
jgi:glutathione S-transferase